MPPADERTGKQAAAQQAVDILHEIATILNCQLDRRTLSICISMIENGVNPEALASAVRELRNESVDIEQQRLAAALGGRKRQ
ncbi:mitotic-spindle organizing protein 1 [Zalerion maritima]|uniref:Mitotic-spindle organizing protein 1 n=1 Tax=Zalerion maritima TaxID=339359 RepID=A0AAD5RSH5_9PEZI|nr:mitotic-spindle organizing protein 1 [Zalerion maritima]